jgi:hypothetical protein
MAAYANRTDLNAAQGTYGDIKKAKDAQRAVPMGKAPTDVGRGVAAPQYSIPGTLGAFDRPTERPNEPITAGSNFGPGPNAMQAGIPIMMNAQMQAKEELRAIYSMYPNEDLADLLNAMTSEAQ